jgi:L-alanine-DL-glutamate epimerase-like enolase superfamily enzyme
MIIRGLEVLDLRFPTSRTNAGTDAVHVDPDYSAAYVDHLHEHFEEPVAVRRGRYIAPTHPGYSITIREASRLAYRYPDGDVWVA